MNLVDAIRHRHSVRNFDGTPLTTAQVENINKAIATAKAPFGGEFVIKLASVGESGEFHPSTYGVISGAKEYLLLGAGDDAASAMSAGFAMEAVILMAQALGLGSCWLSSTFRDRSFAAVASELGSNTPLKATAPIGVPSGKGGFLNTLKRLWSRSDKRKDLEELFFDNTVTVPLHVGSMWREPLDLMRWAPSSTNSQPWRAIVHHGQVDFYLIDDSLLSYLNMGIGLCHFTIGCDQKGIPGRFEVHPPMNTPSEWHYVTSYVRA